MSFTLERTRSRVLFHECNGKDPRPTSEQFDFPLEKGCHSFYEDRLTLYYPVCGCEQSHLWISRFRFEDGSYIVQTSDKYINVPRSKDLNPLKPRTWLQTATESESIFGKVVHHLVIVRCVQHRNQPVNVCLPGSSSPPPARGRASSGPCRIGRSCLLGGTF